jgi:hypothetical protein
MICDLGRGEKEDDEKEGKNDEQMNRWINEKKKD